MSALAIAGFFPNLPVVRYERSREVSANEQRVAAGFRPFTRRKTNAKSSAADAKFLGRWVGAIFVEAREGGVYRCRCRCGAVVRFSPRRIVTYRGDGVRVGCGVRCPLVLARNPGRPARSKR